MLKRDRKTAAGAALPPAVKKAALPGALLLAALVLAAVVNLRLFAALLLAALAAAFAFLLRLGMVGCTGPLLRPGLALCAKKFELRYGSRPKGEIVFYGASNFTFWKTLEDDMKPYAAQNHGFGGSTDALMEQQAGRMLYPYEPSVVFLQTGSNDNARGLTLEQIQRNKERLFAEYRSHLPQTRFVVMSGLPLPGRPQYWENIQALNRFLVDYCARTERMEFIDATAAMTTPEGAFRPEYFVRDGIHLNAQGHAVWTRLMHEKLREMGVQP